ncbi:hypothetical protein L596_009085 [Steinernema carpocapsae]|uniref:Uncharacterized protein n=1 Tax=Steinernema carpocapsae TaxID=34508 RepID=A0A4U5PEM0_STECR|nr:hypothetical protein L596_009085 [Steinernema carpocapsae]
MPSTVNCSGPSPSKTKSSTPDPIMSTPKSSKQQQRSRRRPQKPLVIFPSSSPTSLASRDHCTSAPAKTFQSRTSNMSQNISTTQSTPKSRRHHHRSVCSGSPSFFAASKMTESPHANDVPLPRARGSLGPMPRRSPRSARTSPRSRSRRPNRRPPTAAPSPPTTQASPPRVSAALEWTPCS